MVEGDPLLGGLDQDVLIVHLCVGVDDDRLHPDHSHPVLLLVGQEEVEQERRGHCPGAHLYRTVVHQVPREVGALAVVLHEVLEEADDVEA